MTTILATFFAIVCTALSYALFRQMRQWNAVLGETDWPSTIMTIFLAAWVQIAGIVMAVIAWVSASSS